MPSALIIQHGENGPAGLVADRLEHHGYELHTWFPGTLGNGNTPDATGFDLVVPLGSAHSVYDIATVGSWIDGELDAAWFARKGIDTDAMLDGFAHHRHTALVNLHRMLDRFLDDTRS